MKILHLTTFLQGGAGLAIATLAVEQQLAGHDVQVVTSEAVSDPAYGNYPAHLERLRSAEVPCHLVRSLFLRDGVARRQALRGIESATGPFEAWDVVHTHAGHPSALALLLRRRVARRQPAGNRLPAIVQTMHGWGVAKTARQAARDLAALRRVDAIAVPAHAAAAQLRAMSPDLPLPEVIGYGVAPGAGTASLDDPLPAAIRRWKALGQFVLVSVGTLGPRKNQQLLVRALAHVPTAVRCVLVGEGDAEPLLALASTLGVGSRVTCAGYHPQAREVARGADAAVFPSLQEGQPTAVIEACLDGLPVVASRTPEMIELLHGGQLGLLFDPADPLDLARAIRVAQGHANVDVGAMCARAHRRAAAEHSVERMLAAYESFYRCAQARAAGTALQHPGATATAA